MFEYSILIKNGNCQPYILQTYNNIESAKAALYNIVTLEEDRGRFFYVDNDFFYNKYPLGNGKYICIKEREVSNWENYSEYKRKSKSKNICVL